MNRAARAHPLTRRCPLIAVLVLCVAALAVVAGCAGGNRVIRHNTLETGALPAPSAIKDYPEALATAIAVMKDTFGLDARQVTLYLYENRRAFERGLIEAGDISPAVAESTVQYARAIGTRGKILVNAEELAHATWPDRLRLLTHELTHVAQFSLSGGIRSNSDQWLREGYADWVSFQLVERLGLDRYARLRNDLAARLNLARRRQPLPSVADLASFREWDAIRDQRGGTVTYGVAFFAVEHLLRTRGPEAVARYFRLFAESQDRLGNFRTAFGIDFDDFERDFLNALEAVLR
ncbi:MAG TPA: hypothetical protein VJO34_16880 [Methylomirabilota bacterium]|nr:hypothetical protein [Methylomirabilota bacterium]